MTRAGIVAWLKKKGIEPDTVDIEGEYDSSLSYSQNLQHFKSYLKLGKGSRTQKEYDDQWCRTLLDMCIQGDKEACKAKKRDCEINKKGTKKSKPKGKSMKAVKPLSRDTRRKKKKVCKRVKVKRHTRRCPKTGRYLK